MTVNAGLVEGDERTIREASALADVPVMRAAYGIANEGPA